MTAAPRPLQRTVLLNLLFIFEGSSLFLLDVVLAATLGLNRFSDVLYAAWALPLTIGRGAFQSLTNSLMGLFAEAEDDASAFSQSVSVIGSFSFILAASMSLTSRWWFPLTLPGAPREDVMAGIPLAAALSWLIALLALAETQRAIYYRLGKIYVPSIGRVVGTLVSVGIILMASRQDNLSLISFGLVIGAAVETFIGFAGLAFHGVKLRFAWPPVVQLRRMMKVVGLPLIGQVVLVSASTLQRALASYLGPGAVTAVTYSRRIFEMLERFVFRGFVVATIQAYTAGVDIQWRRQTRLLVLVSIPLFVIFAVLPTALVSVLFERGRFSAEAANLVSSTLQMYALAIPILALNRIPYALAFAQTKSRELLSYAAIFALVLIGSEIGFIALGLNLRSFGLSYALALTISTIWLYPRVTRNVDIPSWTMDEVLRLLGVTVVAFLGTALCVRAIDLLIIDPTLNSWVQVILGAGVCFALTALAAWRFRLVETANLMRLLRGASR